MLGSLLYEQNVLLIALSRVEVEFRLSTLMTVSRLI